MLNIDGQWRGGEGGGGGRGKGRGRRGEGGRVKKEEEGGREG